MLTLFGEAFQEPHTYSSSGPSKAYLERLLRDVASSGRRNTGLKFLFRRLES